MRRIVLNISIIGILLVLVDMTFAQQWTQALIFSENQVVQDSLHFGIDPSGTDGIDVALGEIEQPPKPVAGVFDIRFTGTLIGNGLKKEFRSNSTDTKEYTIDIQRASAGEISISWGTLQPGTFVMQDLFGGIIFNVDMKTTNQATISNAAITQIKLIVTPGEDTNSPPVFVTTSLSDATEGKAYSDTLKATDPDENDVLTFGIITGPSWLSVDTSGVLSGTPGANDLGSNTISIKVTDNRGLSDTLSTTISVNAKPVTNNPPVFVTTSLPNASVGQAYSFMVEVADPDSVDVQTYELIISPTWISIDSAGVLSGTPGAIDVGSNIISINVTDSGELSDTLNTVIEVNAKPDITFSWTQALIFSENQVVQDSLHFGIDPAGSDGIDASLEEIELPPKPVAGVFDIRFTGTVLGNGLKKDIRLASTDTKEYTIDIQRAAAGEISISWGTLQAGTFVMQDLFGGIIFNVDMKTTNQATITNAAVTQIKLIVKPEIPPPGGPIDVKPPVITDGPVVNANDTSTVIILWRTNEVANSQVKFSTFEFSEITDWNITQPEFTKNHRVVLEGLMSDTKYFYQVGSTDTSKNGPTVSRIRNFKTRAKPDIDEPVFLLPPELISRDTSSVRIRFVTNEVATTAIFYKKDSLSSTNELLLFQDSSLVFEHLSVISGLEPDTRYEAFAQVFDASGNGPVKSREFEFKTLAKPDTRKPRFLGFPTVLVRDTNFVIIRWSTNENSTSVIAYETVDRFTTSQIIVEDETLTRIHELTITGLIPNTQYEYIIKSADAQNNEAVSSRSFKFKTSKTADIDPPIIFGNPHVVERDTDRVTIQWKTNEISSSIVEIAIEADFDNESQRTTLTDDNLTKDHSVTVLDLKSDTPYAYRVGSVDAIGNGPSYSKRRETKTRIAADNKPPIIFGIPEVHPVDTSSVVIAWNTDEISNSRVTFYPEKDLTNIASIEDQNLSIKHSVILTDLTPGTRYIFFIFSSDTRGNIKDKGPFSFTTPDKQDTEPPIFIRFPAVVNIDTSSFVVAWETDELSSAFLDYVQTSSPADTNTVGDEKLLKRHFIFVEGLITNTEYSIRVRSFDQIGNGPLESAWFELKTRKQPDLNPPKIIGFPVVVNTDTNSASIKWLTDEAAISEIEYGLATEWPSNTIMELLPDFFQKSRNNTNEFACEFGILLLGSGN